MSGLATKMREALGCAYVATRGMTCFDLELRANWPFCPACVVLRDATHATCVALDFAAGRLAKLEAALRDAVQARRWCPCANCMSALDNDAMPDRCLLAAVWAAMSDAPSTPQQEEKT